MTYAILSLVIFIEAATIVALVSVLTRQQATLFRAAMSRTPGEFRKLESEARPRPAPAKKSSLDEATAMVLESVTSSDDVPYPMPHGLGGD